MGNSSGAGLWCGQESSTGAVNRAIGVQSGSQQAQTVPKTAFSVRPEDQQGD